jgi:small subunit ribosomal protein S1
MTKEIKKTEEKKEENNHTPEQKIIQKLLEGTPSRPSLGDSIEGVVVSIEKGKIFVDIPPFGTGIIYGREFMHAADILRKVKMRDAIVAKVVDVENEDGYMELSLTEAREALMWGEAEQAVQKNTIFDLVVKDANKGGLMVEWQGIQGFLPASQLTHDHYPRVEDGDKDKILSELRALIGQKVHVCIITADAQEGKLIFSEKVSEQKGTEENTTQEESKKFSVGDACDGEVTGIVDFGVFVKISEGVEGLVHISEIDWGLVENIKSLYKVGDEVRVKIIEMKDGKVSLSIKALREDPWKHAAQTYKKDSIVNAVVIKHNKHGALASIEEGVSGLVHVSEFADIQELRTTLQLGRSYPFKITLFEAEEHKMTLSYKKALQGEAKEEE